jgi:hypothetical protein
MTKRASFFAPKPAEVLQDDTPTSQPVSLPAGQHVDAPARQPYPKATTRQGRKAVTVYVEPETKRQLDKLVFEAKGDDPDFALQDLMIEAINALFAKRGVTRLAS